MLLFEYFMYTSDKSAPMLRLYDTYVEPFNRVYREHRHTAFEISVCCSGSGIYQAGDEVYTIERGAVFMFGSNDPHCITKINPGEDMLLTSVQFEPRFLWAYGEHDFDLRYLELFSDKGLPVRRKFDAGDETAENIGEYLFDMKKEYNEKKNEFEYMIRSDLLRLLIIIIRRYSEYTAGEEFSVRKYNITNLDKAMDYIDKNYDTDISLKELAEIAGMSRTYFSALFKKLNGLSPWDYITIRRIEKSVELLKTTGDTVLEIACRCGYNSTANFNRAFKKITGRVPGDYRR